MDLAEKILELMDEQGITNTDSLKKLVSPIQVLLRFFPDKQSTLKLIHFKQLQIFSVNHSITLWIRKKSSRLLIGLLLKI